MGVKKFFFFFGCIACFESKRNIYIYINLLKRAIYKIYSSLTKVNTKHQKNESKSTINAKRKQRQV